MIFVHSWWFEFDRKDSDKMLLLPGNIKGTFLVREATGMTITFIKSNFFRIEFRIELDLKLDIKLNLFFYSLMPVQTRL